MFICICCLSKLLLANSDKIKCNQGNQSGPQGSGGSEQTDPAPAKGAGLQIPVVAPVDPNEIIGPQGYVDADSLRWVSTDATLGYTIYFENDPEMDRNLFLDGIYIIYSVIYCPARRHAAFAAGSRDLCA